jgi:hypothetical protein
MRSRRDSNPAEIAKHQPHRGLLRFARNDIPGTCHCEEQGDEAISIAECTLLYLRQGELRANAASLWCIFEVPAK